jgi:hypothetical protein
LKSRKILEISAKNRYAQEDESKGEHNRCGDKHVNRDEFMDSSHIDPISVPESDLSSSFVMRGEHVVIKQASHYTTCIQRSNTLSTVA